jgi:N-acetylneuraminic acid mutarotase
LGAPISGAVVVPGGVSGDDQLTILGGETTGGLTASGAFSLDVTTGTLTQVGDLMSTLDNATGAVLDGQVDVFGGTPSSSSAATATVQALTEAPTSASSATGTVEPTATAVGTLPQPRAAGSSVTSGTTSYLVGGSNAVGAVPSVLATTDGRRFVALASLRVPVQFPAVTVFDGNLYIFGGTAGGGSDAGQPVRTIQILSLKTHRVSDSRHLPEPLTGAAAVVIGHDILLAGGDTASPPTTTVTSTSASTATSTPAQSTSSTIWSFDPASGRFRAVGHLPVPVSHAGAAVLGTTAWLVGGESDGTPVSAVQSFVTVPPKS